MDIAGIDALVSSYLSHVNYFDYACRTLRLHLSLPVKHNFKLNIYIFSDSFMFYSRNKYTLDVLLLLNISLLGKTMGLCGIYLRSLY